MKTKEEKAIEEKGKQNKSMQGLSEKSNLPYNTK